MKTIKLIMILSALLICTSCGNVPDNTNSTAEDTAASDTNDTKTKKNKKEAIKKISIGSAIKTHDFKIKIKNIEFSYDVLPDDTSSFYEHYPAEKGNVYIHIDTDVKNKMKRKVRCDSIMSVVANYDDGYTYSSQAIPEDPSLGFNYANITSIDPLKTLGVRFIIEVPEEVKKSKKKSLVLNFDVGGKKYKYVMR